MRSTLPVYPWGVPHAPSSARPFTRPRWTPSSWIRLPDAIVTAVVALALASAVTVTAGIHRPWTTLPLSLLIGLALWRAVRPPRDGLDDAGGAGADAHAAVPGTDATAWATSARVVLAWTALWVLVNAFGRAEYLIVSRDPGFLTLTGMWLVDHPSTDIPVGPALDAASHHWASLADAEQAWNLRGTMIQPQGAKMLPALISVFGWLAGSEGVLIANVLIGGAGILAVYLVARRFVPPAWAFIPAIALGVTVSHIALSRAAYTEPLTLLLVCAGLAWAWQGVESGRLGPLFAAGAATGATALVRIDGAAFAASALVALALAIALGARLGADHGHAFRQRGLLVYTASQLAFTTLGYWSLWRWSEAYLDRLWPQTESILLLYGLSVAVAVLWGLTFTRAVRGERLVTAPVARLGRRGPAAAAGITAAVLVVLASRPLWTTVHRGGTTEEDQFTNSVVGAFQQLQGLPYDPTRTYAESTVTWLSYYLTWPLIALATVGFAAAVWIALTKRPGWLLLVVGMLAPTMLYLLKPEIVPDQIWAIRRFEPAAMPAFVLAATLGAVAALAWWSRTQRLRGQSRQNSRDRSLAHVARLLLVLLPATTWISIKPHEEYPISVAMHVFTREMQGAKGQFEGLCEIIDGRPVILYGTSSHFGPIRVLCDVPVVLQLAEIAPASLAQINDDLGGNAILLTRSPEELEWSAPSSVVLDAPTYQAEFRLQGIPRIVNVQDYQWHAGLVGEHGVLDPLPSIAPTIS